MKIAIFQLSDFHVHGTSDLVHRYLPDVANVVRELSFPQVDKIVVVLCGDVAFSGKQSEYNAILPTLYKLSYNFKSAGVYDVEFIVIPGNHDCDFDLDDAVRDFLIKSIPQNTQVLSDSSIIEQCIKVQKGFWDFEKDGLFRKPEKNRDFIYLEHDLTMGGRQIRFRCYNTAWVSQNPERPGEMALPRKYFQGHDLESRVDLCISILHHPTHWLTPTRKRELDVILDHASDLIMFGHEHLPEGYSKSDFDGDSTGYLYGGAFQESPHECPGVFNVIIVDIGAGQHQLRSYERSGNTFRRTNKDEWSSLGRPSFNSVNGLHLSPDFVKYLEDPEVTFAHRSGRALKLEDIFILPDFSSLSTEGSASSVSQERLIRGARFDSLVREKEKLFILGRERSGRTSLAKKTFWNLYREGATPILLDGGRISAASLKNPEKIFQHALFSNYENPELPTFEQSAIANRALIIDGFEKARLSASERSKFLRDAERKFGKIIVFGDLLMMVEEVASGIMLEEALPTFTRLEIKELGRSARRRLITRWLSIELPADVEELQSRVDDVERIIDTLLGKSFLPSYPIFILSFIQTIESSRPMDNIGSYGYHYEAFITNSLSQSECGINIDIQYQFLSELAYRLFLSETPEIEELDFQIFYRNYCEKYGIAPDRKLLLQSLLESRLLEVRDESYRFKYPYAYYFFVARYFRDNLDESPVKEALRDMCRNFHIERNANVWMFLAHLSKSSFLLNLICEAAKSIFAKYDLLRLEGDVEFLKDLPELVPTLTLPDSRPEENRDEYDAALERLEREDDLSMPEEESRNILKEIDAMVRTIQVLGQMLKNFPGSLNAQEKANIVEESFGLGLRGLSFIVGAFAEGREEIVQVVANRIARKYNIDGASEELNRRVRGVLFWLLRANVFGVIKLISHGVGAKGEELTYRKVVEKLDSNAAKLVEVSIGLDTLKVPRRRIIELHEEFRSDVFNRHLLASLVARHFYLFHVPNNVKDELCKKLGIGVQQIDKADALMGQHTKRV